MQMQVSSLSSASQYLSSFSREASKSVGPWSGVILATSITALVGLGAYSWSRRNAAAAAAADNDVLEPEVKSRIQKTYAYVFSGFALTGLSATLAHVNGVSLSLLRGSWYTYLGLSILTVASLAATMLTDKENYKMKNAAFVTFNVCMGLSLSPIGFLDKAIVAQAAAISLGLGGMLSAVAFYAPDETFLKWEGPLLTALTTISIASCVAVFFPRSAYAYGVDRVSLYGGLAIFSAMLMSSTQRILQDAKELSDQRFDAMRSSLNVYLDTVNIFVRVLRILAERREQDA